MEKNAYLKHMAIGGTLGGISGALYGYMFPINRRTSKNGRIESSKDNALGGAASGALIGAYLKGIKVKLSKVDNNGYTNTYTSKFRDVDANLKHFKASKSSFKTKADASKHFKSYLHKAHPDKGGDAEHFKKLNTARENIMKSDWFEKLSMENKYLEKIASIYNIEVPKSVSNELELGGVKSLTLNENEHNKYLRHLENNAPSIGKYLINAGTGAFAGGYAGHILTKGLRNHSNPVVAGAAYLAPVLTTYLGARAGIKAVDDKSKVQALSSVKGKQKYD